MKTERLIPAGQTFGAWSVDSGPRVWNDRNIWTEINDRFHAAEVEVASALLRRYLEHTATVLADSLRAQVDFRGDGQYDLGS